MDFKSFGKFREPLEDFFDSNEIQLLFKEYLEIEDHWANFFKKINSINLLIIGEAPLSSCKYIYHPKSKDVGSPFLFKKHLIESLKIFQGSKHNSETKTKIELMTELGILVIEAYPYTLDPLKHQFNFQKGLSKKDKIELFRRTKSWHFLKKMELIKPKIDNHTIYAFRYKGNMDNLQALLDIKHDISNLGGKGGNLNKEEFFKIFQKLNHA